MATMATAAMSSAPSGGGKLVGEQLAALKTQELFALWLSKEETAAQVEEWLRLAQEGQLEEPPERVNLEGLLGSKPTTPRTPALPSPLRGLKTLSKIPARARSASLEEEAMLVDRWPGRRDQPLPLLRFAPFAAEVCDLPTIAGPLIFGKLTGQDLADEQKKKKSSESSSSNNNNNDDAEDDDDDTSSTNNAVSLEQFLAFWRREIRGKRRRADRLFSVLSGGGGERRGLSEEDLQPLLRFVVNTHPGLAFLADHREFQAKYAATVIARMFYRANVSRTGTISKREFREADVVDALFKLESTDDVNAETSYFSYEHFYVLYCQFWELDQDKDAKLTRTDLLKYGGHRLSRAIVDRVFDAAPRPFADGKCGATLRRKIRGAAGHKKAKLRRVQSTNQPFLARKTTAWGGGGGAVGEQPQPQQLRDNTTRDEPHFAAAESSERAAAAAEGQVVGGRRRRDDDGLLEDDDDDDDGGGLLEDDDDDDVSDDDEGGLLAELAAAAAARLPPDVGEDRLASVEEDAMSYEDFVYFMLSEEDKGNEASLRYWFACVDVDGDGVIDARDAKHFYDVQAQRMECLGHEVVPLDDVLCQMADLLNADETTPLTKSAPPPHGGGGGENSNTKSQPRGPDPLQQPPPPRKKWRRKKHRDPMRLRLEVADFLQPSKIRVAGVFFDALFSLDKFVAFEQRDPFAERLKRDDPFDNEWERFAAQEYSRLATEDDDDDDEDDDDDDDEHNNHAGGGGGGAKLDVDGDGVDDDDDDTFPGSASKPTASSSARSSSSSSSSSSPNEAPF